MMHEIKYAKKYDNGVPVKWYSNEYFELAVWFHDNGDIKSFQLCYDRNRKAHALTWKDGMGFSYDKVDTGDNPGYHKMSPILVQDGPFPREEIANKFLTASKEIDSGISRFVYEKILIYGNG